MARVKRGVAAHKRHKRLLKDAEGRRGTRSKLIKPAREAQLHALAYAYRGRKERKRQLRALWIVRLNAAVREQGHKSYSTFIAKVKKNNFALDRKVLAEFASEKPEIFARISKQVV